MVEVIQKEVRRRQEDLKCEQMHLEQSCCHTLLQRHPLLRQPVTALPASAAHLIRVWQQDQCQACALQPEVMLSNIDAICCIILATCA